MEHVEPADAEKVTEFLTNIGYSLTIVDLNVRIKKVFVEEQKSVSGFASSYS